MLLYCFASIDMVTVFETVSAFNDECMHLSALYFTFDWSRPPVGEVL